MKNYLSTALAALIVASCAQTPKEISTETLSAADSTKFVTMSMNLELPAGKDAVSSNIRKELLSVAALQLQELTEPQDSSMAVPEGIDEAGIKELYHSSLAEIDSLSKGDYDERNSYILSDSTMTDDEKESIINDWPGWEISVGIQKVSETDTYAVFSSSNYVYLGGAHGGVTGAGYITFNKKTGKSFTDFLKPDCTEDLQPLIRKGLCEYFSEGGEPVSDEELDENLFEAGQIALPAYTPFPSEEGLNFVYQQYEIAAYAAGMPAFTVSYEDIMPYLTDEAIKLLNL